jgi:cytochrome c oxidase assembly protein subunit 11
MGAPQGSLLDGSQKAVAMINRPSGKKLVTIALCGLAIAVMTTLVSESVTLYRLFCAATGFGTSTQQARAVDMPISKRTIVVHFDANVAPGLQWEFRPLQEQVVTHLGEPTQVFFYSKNLSREPIVARATYNVTPYKIGTYFNKTQCFCFTNERLKPGEEARMAVVFYVDPKLATDPGTSDVQNITLSYTFFRSKDDGSARDLSTATAAEADRDKALVGAAAASRAQAVAHDDRTYRTPAMDTETPASRSRPGF